MGHQCVKCSEIYKDAAKELLEGCSSCGGKFFFYIREEQIEKLKGENVLQELSVEEKEKVEEDVREIMVSPTFQPFYQLVYSKHK